MSDSRDKRELAYINGEYLPLAQARVSVLDRGFLFGDGVYEVVPAYGGRLFRLHEHLQRLRRSLDGVRIANPHDDEEWRRILGGLTRRAGSHDQSIYLQVTRGVAAVRAHAFPQDTAPTVFAMSTPLVGVDPVRREQGLRLITHADVRWQYCHLKTIALLPNVLMQQLARDVGADETLLVRDGVITEGSSSNVFAITGGELVTPPKSPRLLPGITRDLVLELAHENALPCREDEIPLATLYAADEVWVTSSSREVMPAVEVDGKRIGDGKVGPLYRRMLALFEAFKERARAGDTP